MPDPAPKIVLENIDNIVRLEEGAAARRSFGERAGEVIGGFAGTLAFVLLQLAAVAGWILLNTGIVPGITPFDPFPFTLGGGILCLESVLLAAFVLLKQAHEGRLSERRSHLNLQVTLLMEKEVTKVLQMLDRLSAARSIEGITDDETRELSEHTAVHSLAQELDRRLDGQLDERLDAR